jgi:hypothetical protein
VLGGDAARDPAAVGRLVDHQLELVRLFGRPADVDGLVTLERAIAPDARSDEDAFLLALGESLLGGKVDLAPLDSFVEANGPLAPLAQALTGALELAIVHPDDREATLRVLREAERRLVGAAPALPVPARRAAEQIARDCDATRAFLEEDARGITADR